MCQNGLEILSLLVNRLKEDFRPYIQTILHAVIDRLGRYSPPPHPKKILKLLPVSNSQFLYVLFSNRTRLIFVCAGDSKDSVREKAEDFILKLMEWSILPQILWERLLSAFIHRNNKVREEIHKILIVTLNS